MPPRVTPLFGFKQPIVKGGEIVLPVLTGSGEWAELSATPVTWKRIWRALRGATDSKSETPEPRPEPSRKIGFIVAPVPSHANPTLRQPILRPNGQI